MTERIFIDPGHGGNDPGAVGNGLKEKDLTLAIARKTRDYLVNNYANVVIKLSREGDATLSLKQRTDMANAWGATYFASIHINAGGGTGFESYVYNKTDSATKNSQAHVHSAIMAEISGVRDRGKKSANFHVVRETRMQAILTENLFIDTKEDADKLKSESFLNKLAVGHAKGIAKARNLQPKPAHQPKPTAPTIGGQTFYRVITGSFADRKNADKRIIELKRKGFDSFIDVHGKFFRVVTGSFSDRANADARIAELKKAGFDSFIDVYKK